MSLRPTRPLTRKCHSDQHVCLFQQTNGVSPTIQNPTIQSPHLLFFSFSVPSAHLSKGSEHALRSHVDDNSCTHRTSISDYHTHLPFLSKWLNLLETITALPLTNRSSIGRRYRHLTLSSVLEQPFVSYLLFLPSAVRTCIQDTACSFSHTTIRSSTITQRLLDRQDVHCHACAREPGA